MVRFTLSAYTLVVLFAAPMVASAAPGPATVAPTPAPRTSGPSPKITSAPAAPQAAPQAVQIDWQARVAIAINDLQVKDPKRLALLEKIQPDRKLGEELTFTQHELQDPRAAAVLLRRLLQGDEPVKVRCAIVDALPHTGGEWQEGAAALIGIDASASVRKKLVQVMRYASAPHNVNGLRLGFKDEDPEINVAAARTSAFSRNATDLIPELYSSTFDTDWDLRAAAVQALGMLKLPQSREVLIKALSDEEREVRLQALLALEQLDPDGIIFMPEIDQLARDHKSHRIARKAEMLLRKRRAAIKAGAKPPPVLAATPAGPAPTNPVAPAPRPAPASKVVSSQGTH